MSHQSRISRLSFILFFYPEEADSARLFLIFSSFIKFLCLLERLISSFDFSRVSHRSIYCKAGKRQVCLAGIIWINPELFFRIKINVNHFEEINDICFLFFKYLINIKCYKNDATFSPRFNSPNTKNKTFIIGELNRQTVYKASTLNINLTLLNRIFDYETI